MLWTAFSLAIRIKEVIPSLKEINLLENEGHYIMGCSMSYIDHNTDQGIEKCIGNFGWENCFRKFESRRRRLEGNNIKKTDHRL
jgi:hypothetical protein